MKLVSEELLKEFRSTGVVVVPNVLSKEEVFRAQKGFHRFLAKEFKFDPEAHFDWKSSSEVKDSEVKEAEKVEVKDWEKLVPSDFTKNSGIIDVFYQYWKMEVHENPKVVGCISDVLAGTYAAETALDPKDDFHNPFAPFDSEKLFFYIDRANFKVPSAMKPARKLVVHVDCDPPYLFSEYPKTESEIDQVIGAYKAEMDACEEFEKMYCFRQLKKRMKWRPLQAFVALTDNPTGNLGGFKAAKGKFNKLLDGVPEDRIPKAPGHEFFVLEDRPDIMSAMEDITYKAGDLIIWDWRTPHTNADLHLGTLPREVIYTPFLPDVAINRVYAQVQKLYFQEKLMPPDFCFCLFKEDPVEKEHELSGLGKRLMGYEIPKEDFSCKLLEKTAAVPTDAPTPTTSSTCTLL